MSIRAIKIPDNEEVDGAVRDLCAAISKQAVLEVDNESEMRKDTMPSPKSVNRIQRTEENDEICAAVNQLSVALSKEAMDNEISKINIDDNDDEEFNKVVSQLCAGISQQAVFELDNEYTQSQPRQRTDVSFETAKLSPKDENETPQAENIQNETCVSPQVVSAKIDTTTNVSDTEQPVMNATPDLIEVKQSRFHRLFRSKQSGRKSSFWTRLRSLCCCGNQEE